MKSNMILMLLAVCLIGVSNSANDANPKEPLHYDLPIVNFRFRLMYCFHKFITPNTRLVLKEITEEAETARKLIKKKEKEAGSEHLVKAIRAITIDNPEKKKVDKVISQAFGGDLGMVLTVIVEVVDVFIIEVEAEYSSPSLNIYKS